MIALVTGGSGFLGRRLAEILTARGCGVRLLVRPSSQVDSHLNQTCEVERRNFDDTGSEDRVGLGRAFKDVQIVYHCAGHSSDWGPWPTFYHANVVAVQNLLRAADSYGSISRFVHVSSTDVYGYPTIPTYESDPLRDVGLPYNRSKMMGDQLVSDVSRRTGLPVTTVRPATIFGPRSKDWVLELCHQLILRRAITIDGGHAPAGLVYVDDVADAMIQLANNPSTIGQAFNIVDPEVFSWREYFSAMADAIGAPRPSIDLTGRIGMAAATLSEFVCRTMRRRNRPLITRHLIFLLSRSQNYPICRLKNAIRTFPLIGLEQGLIDTKKWLSIHGEKSMTHLIYHVDNADALG